VLYHARAEFSVGLRETWLEYGISGNPAIWLAYLLAPFNLGWIGVPVFFVVSGYCIHIGVTGQNVARRGQLDLWKFYFRRFYRIYPVFFVALCLTAIVDQLNSNTSGFNNSSGVFLGNMFFLHEIFFPVFGSNTVFWTLSIEFHLYLFYPLIFMLVIRYGPAFALMFASLVSLVACAAFALFDLGQSFEFARNAPLFISYLAMWVGGVYMAEVEAKRAPRPSGYLWNVTWIIALVVGILSKKAGQAEIALLFLSVGIVGAFSFAMEKIDRQRMGHGGVVSAMVGLGVISYSLYATHRISFELIHYSGMLERSLSGLNIVVGTCIAVAFAAGFYWLVERRTIQTRKAIVT